MRENYKDCYFVYEEDYITIGNSSVERTWNLTDTIPKTISIIDKITGKQWCDKNPAGGAFCHPYIDFSSKSRCELKHIKTDDDYGFAKKYLEAAIAVHYSEVTILWTHKIYPELPVIRSTVSIVPNTNGAKIRTEKCNENYLAYQSRPDIFRLARKESYVDYLPISSNHCQWKAVEFNDITDDNDNLVHIRRGIISERESKYLDGNILTFKDVLTNDSIMMIKEGPTPFGRLEDASGDFIIAGRNAFISGWGFTPEELSKNGEMSSYGSAIIMHSGNETSELRALMQYHNAIHAYDDSRDASVMCNTWGDMSCDGKIGEEFLLKELQLAEKLGINFYQIDDGWQKGLSGASVLPGGIQDKNFYESDPDFWTVNTLRFPNGLEPVIESAKEKGIKIGLWFSPDESDNYSKWERDADTLIGLHKKYGVLSFKIDGVAFREKKAEENLTKMMQKVISATDKKVFFNMDVTADKRGGYFGRVQYGNIFLENRFTDGFPEKPNYYPHRTLRNLWMLGHYYPLYRIQAEFLNVKRNMDLYRGDIFAPSVCGQEYTFALTMFASPLVWMELTGLDDATVQNLAPVIQTYRRHQKVIQSGVTYPIGSEPSGVSWTGFQSKTSATKGYILIIREKNADVSQEITLYGLKNTVLSLTPLLGTGCQNNIEIDKNGVAKFELNSEFSYGLYYYSC